MFLNIKSFPIGERTNEALGGVCTLAQILETSLYKFCQNLGIILYHVVEMSVFIAHFDLIAPKIYNLIAIMI